MKQQILDRLNELIVEERGKPVKMTSSLRDAELDSLGTMIVLASLEADYPFMKDAPGQGYEILDIPNLTIRELIRKCVLSITSTSTEPNDKETAG